MTITDYIKEKYPIESVLRSKFSDPIKRVENEDSIPFDYIGYDEEGNLCKLIEVEPMRAIPVHELLSYHRKDIEELNDPALLNVYDNFMEQVDIKDINFSDIMRSLQTLNDIRKKREGQLNNVLSGEG